MRFLAAALLLALACAGEPPGPVHFAREEIEVSARPGTIEVRGNYHFTCSAREPLRGQVDYPFPIDSFHAFPDSVAIPGHDFSLTESSAVFWMRFRPGAEDSFRAYYRQRLNGNSGRYIVTTTRRWNRAIDTARFRVTVPRGLAGARPNFAPDSERVTDSTVTWFWDQRRFFPAEDIIVTWPGTP